MTIRVFLLDDHEIVRRGLRELLEADGDIEVVGESGSAEQAARRIPALRPDVALLDARLPDGSGIEVCRAVRSLDPTIAGLVVTSYDDQEALERAVAAGAAGYVLKDVRGTDIVDAVRRVAAGESLIEDAVRERLRARWTAPGPSDPRLRSLTPQERRVLDLVAEGLTNREVAGRLGVAEKTVKNHVTAVLTKLGLHSRTQAALLAVQQGDRPGEQGRRR